jgi:hypothetical protein
VEEGDELWRRDRLRPGRRLGPGDGLLIDHLGVEACGVVDIAAWFHRIGDAARDAPDRGGDSLDTEREIARLAATAPLSREEIQRRDNDAALAGARLQVLEQAQRALLDTDGLGELAEV